MTKPLTDAEIAELRRTLDADDGGPSAAQEIADAAARLALPRLLDEVEQGRREKYTPAGTVIRMLRDEVKRERALLRRIEWSGTAPDPTVPYEYTAGCPACPATKKIGKHAPWCELAALLEPERVFP